MFLTGRNYSIESENCSQLFYRPQTFCRATLTCFQRGVLGPSKVSVMEHFCEKLLTVKGAKYYRRKYAVGVRPRSLNTSLESY